MHPSHSSINRHPEYNRQDAPQGMDQHFHHIKTMQVVSKQPIKHFCVFLPTYNFSMPTPQAPYKVALPMRLCRGSWCTFKSTSVGRMDVCLQDQATVLSHSVQDLKQQLRFLQLSDNIQLELQPIQDHVRRTSQDLDRSVLLSFGYT